jgi:hypothetical protein
MLFSIVVLLIYITNVKGVPLSPHPRQNLLLFVFLMVGILTAVRWNLNIVLICSSITARNFEHFMWFFLATGFLILKNLCSVHLPISSLGH